MFGNINCRIDLTNEQSAQLRKLLAAEVTAKQLYRTESDYVNDIVQHYLDNPPLDPIAFIPTREAYDDIIRLVNSNGISLNEAINRAITFGIYKQEHPEEFGL